MYPTGIKVKLKPGVDETTPPCGIIQMPGSVRPTAPSTAKAGIAAARYTIAIQTSLPEAFTIHFDSGACTDLRGSAGLDDRDLFHGAFALFFLGPQAPIAEG
jgi:hypothetical protein